MSNFQQHLEEEMEDFTAKVERFQQERETNPGRCSHCQFETTELKNYSRHYGGNVGAHWLCVYCEGTLSASRLGAGLQKDSAIADVAAMLNLLERRIKGVS